MRVIKREIKENLVYVALWLTMFIAPVVAIYVHSLSDQHPEGFAWEEVFRVWRLYAVYLIVFIVHNYLIAPMLIYRHRKTVYFGSVTLLLAAFVLYQCEVATPPAPREGPQDMAFSEGPPPPPLDDGHQPGEPPDRHQPGSPPGERPPHHGPADGKPPMMQLETVFSVMVFLMMLGMNLGVKYYFKADDDQKEREELERKSLEQQLAYLKYQINPHFFMNTLNNIHALVDIDPERAKQTILILSRIMRHVLYEGDRSTIPLKQELDFLSNYIELMRIRYSSDGVDIHLDIPQQLPELSVPPLLFITFVENAFKHGISYKTASYIHIGVKADGKRLKFVCKNSKPATPQTAAKGGVGLANVKQRLNLLYGKNYTLDIDDAHDSYEVILLLPLQMG